MIAVATAWLALAGAIPAIASGSYPTDMPATPMPDIKGCSPSQEAYIKDAWRRAHFYTWRATAVMDHIRAQTGSAREALWSRPFPNLQWGTPSPRRWFGLYDNERSKFADEAIDKAEARFRMQGNVVKGIKTLRCGQPIAKRDDAHIDVCPATGSSSGPPSAYHFPIGTIVTCPAFWNDATNNFVHHETRMANSAFTLVHEIFHWLSVDEKYVVDYHADGAGGHPDGHYYGLQDVTYLAENNPSWAIRNNDTYAWFARSVGETEPTFAGVWLRKEPGGIGGIYDDQNWEWLVSRWKEFRQNQYLADVEVYRRGEEWRYAALWRARPGNGALLFQPWDDFEKTWNDLKDTQDLIDVEVVQTDNGLK